MGVFLTAVSIGMGLVSTIFQNQALGDQNAALAEQNALDEIELTRQQEEVNKQSGERKSDIARQADASFASMIVAMADGGGAGGVNQLRLGGDIGSIEGIDLARIEGNRRRQVESIQSRKEGSVITARSQIKSNVSQGIGNTISFLGSTATTLATRPKTTTTTTTTSNRQPGRRPNVRK